VKITFYTFTMGDVDDIDIYAAQLIWEWQQTDQGCWVMENAHDLTYRAYNDIKNWMYKASIRGEIRDPRKVTEYYLRWPNQEKS